MRLYDLDVTLNAGALEWIISTEIDGKAYATAIIAPVLTDENAVRRVTKAFRKKFATLLAEHGLIEDNVYEIGLWANDF